MVLIAGALIGSACGSETASHVPPADRQTEWVPELRTRQPAISGGTAAQRALLRAIVKDLRPTQLTTIQVRRAGEGWIPLKRGDVELRTIVARARNHRENSRGTWEGWLVGGAFRDRSAALGLPRVVVVSSADRASRVQPTSAIQPADPSALPAFRQSVQQAVEKSGARLALLRTGIPDGFAADISIETSRPVAFFKHGLPRLESALWALKSDGFFISVHLSNGHPLYVGGSSARLSSGFSGVLDRRYDSCVSHLSRSLRMAPEVPCPSDWRPPSSTPRKPLSLQGWSAAGAALGDWNGSAGITVSYRRGATLGLGMTIQNLNGHGATVLSIIPAMDDTGPLLYTGARIQIPPSRERPGRAAELQMPFGPVPPFDPFTIKPGDWVGVAMHFAIGRCTPANAGRVVTADRTVEIVWRIKGRTERHAYDNVPLVLHVPSGCAG
jgi:hypothetical protein